MDRLYKDIETIINLQTDTKSYISMLAIKVNRMSKELDKTFFQVANVLLKNHIIRLTDYDKIITYYQQVIYRHYNIIDNNLYN